MSQNNIMDCAIQATAKITGIPAREFVQSELRWPERVRARQIAYYVIRKTTPGISLPTIGKKFHWRDHTTVLNGLRRATARMKHDTDFRNDTKQVGSLMRELLQGNRQ